MDEVSAISELVQAFLAIVANGGPLAIAGAGVTLVIRLYRLSVVQQFLPDSLKWANQPWYIKLGAPFGIAGLGAVLAGLTAGASWPAIVAMAISAGIASVLGHHVTKTTGAVIDAILPGKAAQSLVRKSVALVFPSPVKDPKVPKFTIVK